MELRHGAAEEVPLSAASAAPSPEQSAIDQDMLRTLAAVLAEVPSDAPGVRMNRISGQSVAEIASSLDLSQGFVYRLLREATAHAQAPARTVESGASAAFKTGRLHPSPSGEKMHEPATDWGRRDG